MTINYRVDECLRPVLNFVVPNWQLHDGKPRNWVTGAFGVS